MNIGEGCFADVPFSLAASSEMLFVDLPPLERVRRIDAATRRRSCRGRPRG